ncbi:unnamed protein product [Rotaria socialis]|uniref:Peptidase C45 hydrolase domain-containing protein n=1 Tax=Rotaria socialis TaxID=392032 RepID=A0A817TDP4_9BILA|nr:unnamed protein product [Rotaria socialis]CAF3367964.1 unnamed protein product [Rotaria socialis]CAF3393352.1 unnamed protein product [Rotaria socialis]CAF3414329.1 unnamed protein product [Rotaria socialis]
MTSSRIPLYHVKGTHYECAYSIGVITCDRIRQRIADSMDELSTLFAFIQTECGRQLHQEFIETIRLLFPWYWDEIRGLVDGSEVPLEQILVLNFLNETLTAQRLFEEKQKLDPTNEKFINETGEKGCTTVLLNRKDTNTFSLLHNEDHASALYLTGYLVEADIRSSEYGDEKRQSPNEKFIAYCYAGVTPGTAFGANKHGFAFGLNGLYPKYVAHKRLPRQIINRALLSIENEQDLDNLLRLYPVAFGFCINGAFFRQNNYLLNYEIGPNLNKDNGNYLSKCFVVNDDQKENRKEDEGYTVLNYFVHYNHYERLNEVIIEQKSLGSTHTRSKRGQELGQISTISDALDLLGDTKNEAYAIFRTLEKNRNACTLCTAHFNFQTLHLSIYESNPKTTHQPSIIYNLNDLFI